MSTSPLRSLAALCSLVAVVTGCGTLASSAPSASAPSAIRAIDLRDEAGSSVRLGELVARSKLTILFFFDAECPVQKSHDARLRELMSTYGPRGTAFFGVVSDVGDDVPAVRAVAKQRGLPPLLEDRGAQLARTLDVEFSTHAVVLGQDARVLYSGGIDSDRSHLSADRQRWLENAIQDALAGRPIAKARTEALGCPLSTR